MARGKSRKRKPNYLKTITEARGLNPASLARYLRDRFDDKDAKAADGREALLARVVKQHEVARRRLADPEEPATVQSGTQTGPASAPDTTAAPAPPPGTPPTNVLAGQTAANDIANVAGAFSDAVLNRLGRETGPKEDPLPPADACETYVGNTRITAQGDFPEAAQYPVLSSYVRERESNDLTYFRGADGRRLMLGKTVEIQAQEHYKGTVPLSVNGLTMFVPREKRVGIPIPHFEQLRQAVETFPITGPEHDMPTGRQEPPPPPPPPRMGKRRTYNVDVFGDCLCDPKTMEVVRELTRIETSMRSMEVETLQPIGAAI